MLKDGLQTTEVKHQTFRLYSLIIEGVPLSAVTGSDNSTMTAKTGVMIRKTGAFYQEGVIQASSPAVLLPARKQAPKLMQLR